MKIAILGATGRTGIVLVEQALEKGYAVKALVRSRDKIHFEHKNLELVQGDVLDPLAVDRVVKNCDAVLCVIGHTKNSPDDLQAKAMQHLTTAMKNNKVNRLIDMTGAGVRDCDDHPKIFDQMIVFALKVMAPKVLEDGNRHAVIIKDSGLDWTIVRAPMLNDGPCTGRYRIGMVGHNSGSKISRADVAHFMLKELTERNYIGKMPMISY